MIMIGHSILENVSNKIQQNKIDARNMILLTVLATFDGIEYLLMVKLVTFHMNITAIFS